MKKILLLAALVVSVAITTAQNAGIGITTPNSSAMLDVVSTNKGVLVPKVAFISDVVNPAPGLLVYVTNGQSYWYYANSTLGWQQLQFNLPQSATLNMSGPVLELKNISTTSSQPSFSMVAMGGTAVRGVSGTTWSGIFGQNDSNGKGVSGLNNGTGHGVHARGANGTALFADIYNNGTGTAARLKQTNTAGWAMMVEGDLSISGGNTNPGANKVLTSDAVGNASWQSAPKTATRRGFEARGMAAGGANVQYRGAWIKYHPAVENYDAGNDFRMIGQVPSSTFVVPVAGVYDINAMIRFPIMHFDDRRVRVVLERAGVKTILAQTLETYPSGNFFENKASLTVNTTARLNTTDLVYVEFYFYNETYGPIEFPTDNMEHYFTMALMDTAN